MKTIHFLLFLSFISFSSCITSYEDDLPSDVDLYSSFEAVYGAVSNTYKGASASCDTDSLSRTVFWETEQLLASWVHYFNAHPYVNTPTDYTESASFYALMAQQVAFQGYQAPEATLALIRHHLTVIQRYLCHVKETASPQAAR